MASALDNARKAEACRAVRADGPWKTSPEQRAKIRRLRAEEGLTYRQLAERFGIHETAVSRILKSEA